MEMERWTLNSDSKLLNKSGRNLYISDLHFDHERILFVDRRKFSSVSEMNAYMVNEWNSSVTVEDTVWILGDISLKLTETAIQCVSHLCGHKHLILGNHDKRRNMSVYNELFESVSTYETIHDEGLLVSLFHYPIESWEGMTYGSVHIHGHTHGNMWDAAPKPNRYNAWCKQLQYRPRPLSWFLESYGYYPNYYRRIADECARQSV